LLSGGSAVIIKTAEVCFSYSMEKEEWIWKAEGSLRKKILRGSGALYGSDQRR